MRKFNKHLSLFLILIFLLTGCDVNNIDNSGKSIGGQVEENILEDELEEDVLEDEAYYDPDKLSIYINKYDKLPKNYITKNKAKELGWISKKGNLWEVAPGMAIGGDKFSNREGKLPKKNGRQYYECDVNYNGGHRGPERLVFSNDGLIYYTDDHYNTFINLFGDEEYGN